VFAVTMLPADQGDCLWLEYGPADRPHRVLIDCGTSPTYKRLMKKLDTLGPSPHFELLIVTHVDTDHIAGVLKLLAKPPAGLSFGQVWFNAWRHIAPDAGDLLGPVDGEILSVQLDKAGWKWNTSFRANGHAAKVSKEGHSLPSKPLPGGLRLTVVSPELEQLDALRDDWKHVVKDAGLAPGVPSQELVDKAGRKGVKLDLLGGDPVRDLAESRPDDLDHTTANGSTIAVLAEFDDEDGVTKRCLLAGDAHGPVLARGIGRLADQLGEARLRLDAFKVPHHGSLRNVTRELIEGVDCRRYLFSSNGAINQHPHMEAVARTVHYGSPEPTLHFNYRTKWNEGWDDSGWKGRYRYETAYGDGTLTVPL
jgi:hypothetical protein